MISSASTRSLSWWRPAFVAATIVFVMLATEAVAQEGFGFSR